MTDTLSTFRLDRTPQTALADPRQTSNSAGGYTFQVTPEQRVRRFLTIGTDGGTYYTRADDLTRANAGAVVKLAETNHRLLVDTIVDISTRGAAPRQNPALFALALAATIGGTDDKRYALDQLDKVARTGTHLFTFVRYLDGFRSWGRSVRRAVGSWYTGKDADALAYQVVKYRQREGWSHRDVLRSAHPATTDPAVSALFDWIVKDTTSDALPRLVEGFRKANEPGAPVAALVRDYGLSWEMLPDDALLHTSVWDALLDVGVPQTALMRQLPRLTRLGMLPPTGGRTAEVAARLADRERLARARVHPINVLVAQRTYASGQSARGDGRWAPNRKIIDALDSAFYAAFGAVEPAGKRTMIGLDVSGSMGAPIAGMPLSCRDASAALALVTLATEPDSAAYGFTSAGGGWFSRHDTGITPLALSPRQRLDDAIRTVSNLPFGGTDCALPMIHARESGLEIDTFIVLTDNETWAGQQHPHQALNAYRQSTGIPARLVVVGMTATDFTIADPTDAGMLDVAGFDTAVPNLISGFSRGI